MEESGQGNGGDAEMKKPEVPGEGDDRRLVDLNNNAKLPIKGPAKIDVGRVANSLKRQYQENKKGQRINEIKIPLQLYDPEFGFLLVRKGEKAPLEKGWQQKLYSKDDRRLLDHLKAGGNYGISPRNGKACLVDADTKDIQDILDAKLPETFRYSTGKPGHFQYAYILDESIGNVPLVDGAYVKGKSGFAVGPGSVHPNGRQYGLDIRDVPVALISKENLLKTLDKFVLTNQKGAKNNSTKKELKDIPEKKVNKAIDSLLEVWSKADGNRHNLTLGIIGYFKKQGWPEEPIQKLIDSLVKQSGKGEEHRTQVSSTFSHEGNHYGFPMMKSIADKIGCPIGEIGDTVKEDPILKGLRFLAGLDEDRASVENEQGFNKLDSEIGHTLAEKERLTKEEHAFAKNLLKKYKKQLSAQLLLDILNSKFSAESAHDEGKKAMPDSEGWQVFSFTNDEPTAWAGWRDGEPYIRQLRDSADGDFSINEKKITLKEYDGKPIKDMILRAKSEEGKDLIEFEGEVFQKPDFVAKMVYPGNVNNFTECLNALKVSDKVFRGPSFYIEDDQIKFPENFYAIHENSYSMQLKKNLKIEPVNEATYREGKGLLMKYPKQLTLRYACVGANIINVLKINDFPITIKAIGKSDTGKSFAIRFSLKIDYGISEAILNDDAMDRAFRHHNIADSTNLIIYIEEAKIRDKSKLKSFAKNLRGNLDKSLTIYGVSMTLVLSMNTDEDIVDPVEKKAIDKRVLEFRFDDIDVVPESERLLGDEYREKIKEMGGGLLYEKLREKPISEIKEKYFQLLRECNRDFRFITAKLGAWVLDDDASFQPVISEDVESTAKEEFIDKIVSAYRRIESMKGWRGDFDNRSTFEDRQLNNELEVDTEKLEFKITVTGFNYVKKQLGITLSARKFAESYEFQYGDFSISGQRGKIIKGPVPKEYADEKIVNSNENVQKDKTKSELDDILEMDE